MSCPLCEQDGGAVLWRDELCRVIRPEVGGYPGFVRVVLNRHAREMTELAGAERDRLMRVVFACERALLALYKLDKINLASFGNQVPHLHWHVIARFSGDAHFPDPVWAARRRPGVEPAAVADGALGAEIARLLREA
jgi:diadenosine tetraphosphate (Ap4A) HIT family hydrolase